MADRELETKISYKILKLILYALLLSPLWVWSIFLFPFITSKILYIRILVEIAFFIYVLLAIQHPEVRPPWNWLTKMVLVYLGIIIVSSIFGIDFGTSFWGTVERGEGIVSILHFAAYFIMLASVLRSERDWRRYLTAAVLVNLVIALYGAFQLVCGNYVSQGLPPPGSCSNLLPTQGIRISATIGNAAFFAAFLLFGMFLSLYLGRLARSRKLKYFFYAVFLFELYILFASETRGAVLGTFVALVVYFFFSILKSPKRVTKAVSVVLLLSLISSAVLVYLNRDSSWVKRNSTLSRFAQISIQDITTQSRLDTWGASWQGLKDRFVLGYGYENYNIAFNKYFPARIYKDRGSQIWFDRAHNIIFDVAVTSGILGLLAYLGILFTAVIILFRLFLRPIESLGWEGPLILGSLLIAYFIQNFFVFDTQATYLMFFVFLAYVSFLQRLRQSEGASPEGSGYHVGYVLPGLLLVFTVISLYFVNIKPARANYYATQGIRTAKLREYRQVESVFRQALSYGTYMDQEIRQKLVDYAYETLNSGMLSPEEQNKLFKYVVSELDKSLEESPRDVKNQLYLMNVLNRSPNDPQAIERIFKLGEEAIKLSPTRPHVYFELGQAAFSKNDFELGLEYFRKAIALNPEPKDSHFNYLLGLIIAKKDDLVTQEIGVITEGLGYRLDVADYTNMARAYFQAGNKLKVIDSYLKASELNPTNAELLAKLAAAYGEVCDLQNAQSTVDKVTELNPSFALEARQFMAQLQTKCAK